MKNRMLNSPRSWNTANKTQWRENYQSVKTSTVISFRDITKSDDFKLTEVNTMARKLSKYKNFKRYFP